MILASIVAKLLRIDIGPPLDHREYWVVHEWQWNGSWNSPVGCQMGYTVGFDVGVGNGFPFGGLAK